MLRLDSRLCFSDDARYVQTTLISRALKVTFGQSRVFECLERCLDAFIVVRHRAG